MAVEEPLPPPQTNLASEIYFRRMLASLERRMNEVQASASDEALGVVPFQPELAKLKTCVDSLQDSVSDLERNNAKDLDLETLAMYKQRVRALASNLPPLSGIPAYCRKPVPAAQRAQATAQAKALSAPPRTRSDGLDSKTGGQQLEFSSSVSDSTRDKLKDHEQIQEDLTSELANMAAQLKSGTQGLQEAVRRRGQIADLTESHMTNSVENAKKIHTKAKDQYKRSGGTFCLTITILLIVVSVFAGMVFYINITHTLLGYSVEKNSPKRYGGKRFDEPDYHHAAQEYEQYQHASRDHAHHKQGQVQDDSNQGHGQGRDRDDYRTQVQDDSTQGHEHDTWDHGQGRDNYEHGHGDHHYNQGHDHDHSYPSSHRGHDEF